MVPPKPSKEGEEARIMLEEDALPVFRRQIRRLVAFRKAALEGVSIYEVKDPRAAWGWEDNKEVGKEVMEER
jgi:chromosome partitioning protein